MRIHQDRLDPHRFDGMPVPKVGVRVRDEAVLQRARRRGKCELCGKPRPTEGHHVRSKASGGSDEPANIVAICRLCHTRVHAGQIPKQAVLDAVAARELDPTVPGGGDGSKVGE